MRNPSPGFVFYVDEWRGSRRVQRMNFAIRAMYFEMLLEQWAAGAAPASPADCAALFGGKTIEWTRAWPLLSKCFVPRRKDGLLVNPKLAAVRRDREAFLKSQRENGLRGARSRWKQHGEPIGSPSGRHATPMAKHGHRSLRDLKESDLKEVRTKTAAARARDDDGGRADFDAFWSAYPKKVGKDAALTAWRKRRPTPDIGQILDALAWQRTQDAWMRDGGRFVPNPATWINQGRWLDEPNTTPTVSDQTLKLMQAGRDFLGGKS